MKRQGAVDSLTYMASFKDTIPIKICTEEFTVEKGLPIFEDLTSYSDSRYVFGVYFRDPKRITILEKNFDFINLLEDDIFDYTTRRIFDAVTQWYYEEQHTICISVLNLFKGLADSGKFYSVTIQSLTAIKIAIPTLDDIIGYENSNILLGLLDIKNDQILLLQEDLTFASVYAGSKDTPGYFYYENIMEALQHELNHK